MKTFVVPLAALALSFSFATAYAGEAGGKIAAVDQSTGIIVLEDGSTFAIGDGLPMEGLTPGTEVTVSYEERDGQLVATDVVPSN